jgi:propionyl-CoA carboxylase alpha chain
MPGAVARVVVAEGDTVHAGQLVCVLEAMKMEHPVTAPGDGVVRRLSVSVGAQVEAGALLAIVDAVHPADIVDAVHPADIPDPTEE